MAADHTRDLANTTIRRACVSVRRHTEKERHFAHARRDRSALAVLRRLAGLLEAVLLALDGPRVAGQEAGLLQRGPVLRLHQDQRPGDGQAQRAGLTGRAATIEVGMD